MLVLALALASKIAVSAPDANYRTTVTGEAGAIEPNAAFVLITLETGHYVTGQAAADGSFAATVFAPRGTAILIKSDPDHRVQLPHSLVGLHGSVVRVPLAPSESGIAFAGAGHDPSLNSAVWIIEGTLSGSRFAPGDVVEARGRYRLLAPADGAGNPQGNVGLNLARIGAYATFESDVMTPTGLPIERFPYFGESGFSPMAIAHDGAGWTGEFNVRLTIPPDLEPGWYLPRLNNGVSGVQPPPPPDPDERRSVLSQFRNLAGKLLLPPVRVGSPAEPRLPAVLFLNDLVEGDRGAVALEDRDRYATANHITTGSDVTVLPRSTRYRLEPFLPTIGLGDRGNPVNPPLLPFRFPSGALTVTVRSPSGATRTIGPAPFRQWHLVGPADRNGFSMEGGPHITDAFELRTLDPAYEIAFEEDGVHTIVLDGSIEDLYGNVWSLDGTYEVHVARPLVIDPAVLPGTPFEVSDAFSGALRVVPPVAADVDIRIRHGARTTHITGKANRFGQFAPATRYRFDEPGEYRVDIVATYRDGASWWVGSMTYGGVVAAPGGSLVAHGRRGIDFQPGEKMPWYFRSQTGDPIGEDHLQFPFHGGDVMWLQESDSAIPIVTLQDLDGGVAAKIDALYRATHPQLNVDPAPRIPIGEIPLLSGNLDGREPHLDPANADIWGYTYRSVQRPLVRVREQIGEDPAEAYWRFNDRYGVQSGSGADGDLPNDFKFQFGGAVLRGRLFDPPMYAIYASLFVLVPDVDPDGGSRVFPPFQGNGGGPGGGPLFRLKGKEIDLFFHPTGVRPGMILQRGERASFAGYSAPPLPSKIEIVVTSPSGATRTIRGQANEVGWFWDPNEDFTPVEAGVWKAKVKITFDGRTSAGQVTEPFPTGDVLGSREGEFNFYVVDSRSEPLEIKPLPPFVRPAGGPVTIESTAPFTYTVTMPGFILAEGTTTGTKYTYDAAKLARDFPNLDLVDRDGAAGADVITISLFAGGAARQVVISGEAVLVPPQDPSRKTRAVRK